MPITYVGKQGKKYLAIEPPLGKGGEGSVYKISGMPDYVLKIFLDNKRTETRHRKLLAMVSTQLSPMAMQQVTWPIDVVYSNGQFVGYVMPAIKNNEDLNVMYSDKYTCTLSEKITIAKNLCAAINAVHNTNQVCGDLNPKNIGVDPKSARVTLVDTDSYHISESNGSRVYRCEVGLPEYLPREIQEKMKNGQTLATASLPTFSKYTDLFALAVHIFALLMNGCHPFACAVNNKVNIGKLTTSQPSITAPQPIDNICNGFFPFYTKRTGITTPKYAPPFSILPQNIQNLFVRAFVDGHANPSKRPDTTEWYNALSNMQQNLIVCSKDKTHMYSSHLKKCPWCTIETNLKPVNKPVAIPKPKINPTPILKPKSTPTSTNTSTNDSVMASSGMFWFLTLTISVCAQAALLGILGNDIIGSVFGTSKGSGMESWGRNLAISMGPLGFIICGIIATIIYNKSCNGGKKNSYTSSNYILSILVSFIGALAWIPIVFIIGVVLEIIVVIFFIALIIGMFSGS